MVRIRVSRNAGKPFVEILTDAGELLQAGVTVWSMQPAIQDGLVVDLSIFPPLDIRIEGDGDPC